MDAGDGLGQADHGRLVACEPGPADAVDAKQQQLDHLCGVRRPLRLAPRDPGAARVRGPLLPRDRRPHGPQPPGGREHALPRPQAPVGGVRRARLRPALRPHPVDHQAAVSSSPGMRDQRRPARHIAHCQPCCRMAVASGLDTAAMARRPVRRAIERARRSCRSPASCARAGSPAASRWCRSPSRWRQRGRRPWPWRRRSSSPASARASASRRAATGPRPSPGRPSPPPSPRAPRRRHPPTARAGRPRPRRAQRACGRGRP